MIEIEERTSSGNKVSPVSMPFHDAMRWFWPREPHGWMYLGTVVDQIGRQMYPSWKPYSAYGLLPDVSVGLTYEGVHVEPREQTLYASWLLDHRKDDADFIYRCNKPFEYLNLGDDKRAFSDEEWSLACDMSQQEWAIGLGNFRMFREIQSKIVKEAESGNLVIGFRPMMGGEPRPTPQDWWFTDNYESRFLYLCIDPEKPFSSEKPVPENAHQLFVQARSLEALIRKYGVEEKPERQIKPDHSPYIKLMLEVAEVLSISPSYQPKKESIIHELQARWESYGLPASGNLVKTAATLLREPDSQAGRAKKEG